MRTKLNKFYTNSEDSHWTHNDIYRRFKNEFDLLLQADSPGLDIDSFNECYVKNEVIETKIKYILNSNSNTIQFLIGKTGVGKSTVLMHVFETSRVPIIRNNSLIVPFSFDGIKVGNYDFEQILSGVISSASKKLLNEFKLDYKEKEFTSYINNHAPDLLFRGNCKITDTYEVLLREFKNTSKYTYALEEFRYLINLSKIKRVIFIVDDIEGKTHSTQVNILQSMCSLYSCLRNNDTRITRTNMLFSVRPETKKIVKDNLDLDAFPISRSIIIKTPAPLNKLFKMRLEYATSKLKKNKTDSWKKAHIILLDIVEHISGLDGYSLLNLFNNNIRETLIEFQELITNRMWIQNNMKPKPSFIINYEDFTFNQNTIFRSLAMRNDKIFPAKGTCIVNIFTNEINEKYDLLIIYIIIYLIEKNDGSEYLDSAVDKSQLIQSFKCLFNIDDFEPTMEQVFSKMLDKKLLIEENDDNKQIVFLQPRALQLWKYLGESSILFGIFRDDTYQNFSKRPKKLSTSLYNDEMFFEYFNFLEEVYKTEKKYREIFVLNKDKENPLIFGNTTITSHLLNGISKSLFAYYHHSTNDLNVGHKIPQSLYNQYNIYKDKVRTLIEF